MRMDNNYNNTNLIYIHFNSWWFVHNDYFVFVNFDSILLISLTLYFFPTSTHTCTLLRFSPSLLLLCIIRGKETAIKLASLGADTIILCRQSRGLVQGGEWYKSDIWSILCVCIYYCQLSVQSFLGSRVFQHIYSAIR